MQPTRGHRPTTTEPDVSEFELSADHLVVLAELPIAQAWRFCRRRRCDLVTPDLGTFVRAVARMGFTAYADLRDAATHADAEIEAWRRAAGLLPH